MSEKPGWKKIRFAGILIAHAMFLIGLTFMFISTDFMHGDEAFMIRNTSAVLRTLLPEPNKPAFDDYAFINVAYNKTLVTRFDKEGFPGGNQPITDRAKLAQLFKVLNQDPNYKYLFCDIFFADPSPDDSLLGVELDKLPRALYSYHLNDSGKPWIPVFPDINLGLADFTEVEGEFLKFRANTKGVPSVPVKMFNEIDGGTFEEGTFAWKLNGKPAFNDFVLDFQIRQYDLFRDTLNYPYANLYDLEMLMDFGMEDQILDFTKDRIVIIGDFEVGDMHPTMYGETSGPVILLNLYLALKDGHNRIPYLFPVYLFLVFGLLSYILFSKTDFFEEWLERKLAGKSRFLILLAQGASYLVILGLISLLSFILFNIHINFLFLTIYFNIAEWLRTKWLDRKSGKENSNQAVPVIKQ